MRAVSLSHTRVIELLNRSLFLSTSRMRTSPILARRPRWRRRSCGASSKKPRTPASPSAASTPTSSRRKDIPSNSLHTADAAHPERLIGLLERSVQRLRSAGGAPVVRPSAPPPPRAGKEVLLLHLTARYLERKGDALVLTGQEDEGGNWSALPSEDWLSLPRARWQRLLPEAPVRTGQTWAIPPGGGDDAIDALLPTNRELGPGHPSNPGAGY